MHTGSQKLKFVSNPKTMTSSIFLWPFGSRYLKLFSLFQNNQNNDPVSPIGNDLRQGRIAVITEKGFEKRPEALFFIKDMINIPNRINDRGYPTQLFQLMNSVSKKAGRDQQDQKTHHLEKSPDGHSFSAE